MRSVIYALFGASFTIATAWALGRLLLRRLSVSLFDAEKRLLAFITGSACLSAVVLALCTAGLARKGLFLVLGLAVNFVAIRADGGCATSKTFPRLPRLWRLLFVFIFSALTVVYLLNAVTPHLALDATTHRLSLVDQAHGFIRTAGAYPLEGFELPFLYAFTFGRHAAAALVNLGFLISLTLLVLCYTHRIERPVAGVAAALLTYLSALAGRHDLLADSGIGTAVVLLSLFYLLRVWDDQGTHALLIPIGILAAFSYAAHYGAIVTVPYAVGCAAWKWWRKPRPAFHPVWAVWILTIFLAAAAFRLPYSDISDARSFMPLVTFGSLAFALLFAQLPRFGAVARSVAHSPAVEPYCARLMKVPWVVWIIVALFCPWLVSYANPSGTARAYFRLEQAWVEHWPVDRQRRSIEQLAPVLCRIGLLGPARIQVEPGVSFLLDPRDLVAVSILRSGKWQPEIWESLSPALSEGSVFLDVGAHIGYFSIKAAVAVGKTGRVVAFEPNPETLKLLRDNVSANNAVNVIVEPIACTDREQTLTLYAAASTNTGASSLARQNADISVEEAPRPYRVRGRPIDEVVREMGLTRVDAVKIDVEGAEVYVLRGAVDTLKRFHPKVVVEVVAQQLASFRTRPEDLTSIVQEAGYNHSRPLGPTDWEWTIEKPRSAKDHE